MRLTRLIVPAALLGLVVAPFPTTTATGSCAAPHLEDVDALTLSIGARTVVEGRAFTSGGCQDSMSCTSTFGCQSCEYDDPPAVPMEDVELRLVQGGRSWTLATADAGTAAGDSLGHVEWVFEVPAGVRPGRALLRADGAEPVRIRVRSAV